DSLVAGIFRVHGRVAGIQVEVAVESSAARLADGVDHDRAFCIFGRVVRSHDLHFRDHIGVGIDRCGGPRGARVHDVLPILGDGNPQAALTVDGHPTQTTGTAAHGKAVDAVHFAGVGQPVHAT